MESDKKRGGKKDIWSLLWVRSALDGEKVPLLPVPNEGDESLQTVAIYGDEKEKSKVERLLRIAGFDRANYSLLPTINMARVIEKESKKNEEKLPPIQSELLQKMLSNGALLSLQRGRESPFEVESVDDVGEYLTHIAAWKHAVKYQIPYLLVISGNKFATAFQNFPQRVERLLREAPEHFDILFLSAQLAFIGSGSEDELSKVKGSKNLVRFASNEKGPMYVDTSAYIVSLNGARKLLERSMPIESRVAPFLFATAKISTNIVSLLTQPFIASVSNSQSKSGKSWQLVDDFAMRMSRCDMMWIIIGLAAISFILLITTIVFLVKWRTKDTTKKSERFRVRKENNKLKNV